MFWLYKTGYQLNWSIIEIGVSRFGEIYPLIAQEFSWGIIAIFLGILLLPLVAWVLLRPRNGVAPERPIRTHTIAVCVVLVLMAGLGYFKRHGVVNPHWLEQSNNDEVTIFWDEVREMRAGVEKGFVSKSLKILNSHSLFIYL